MKHLPISVAGALLLAGSMAVYAQAPPKESMSEEQKPAQGSHQPSQSKEGQGEATKSGQAGSSEGSSKQKRDQDGKGSAAAKSPEGQRAQQDSDKPESQNQQKPAQGSHQQSQSKEGQDETTKSGQAGPSEGKTGQDNPRSERADKNSGAEGSGKQKRDQDGSGSAAAKSPEGQRAQQDGDKAKGPDQQMHAGKRLEVEQRTVVKETIVKRNVRPANINFSITVGSVVPRSVTLYELPPTLVEFQPSYSRYKFILADESTILVIDPETWAIIDVIQI